MGRWVVGYDLAASEPVRDIARISRTPVLLIHGAADPLVPSENARRLQAAHGGAEIWVVSGAGHARSFFADPEGYIDRVASFFDQALAP